MLDMVELDNPTLKKIVLEIESIFDRYDLTGSQALTIITMYQTMLSISYLEKTGLRK